MLSKIGSRLTYANVVATLALFISLGGSAIAARQLINGTSIKAHTIPGNRLKKHTITGTQVNLGALGKVLNAADADSLGGSPASDYRLHCPAGLQQAAGAALCFEPTLRPAAMWTDALQTCALANRRLPTEDELALVFNNTGAPQSQQLTSTLLYASGYQAVFLQDNTSRQISFGSVAYTNPVVAYRCVTNATN